MTVERGFYRHYKHDPNGPFGNHVYEVVNLAYHTERRDEVLVIYRPLYEAFVYKAGKHFDARPMEMFLETVEKNGKTISRFDHITDPEEVKKCEDLRDEMYKEMPTQFSDK